MISFHSLVLDFCKSESANPTSTKWMVEEKKTGYSLISTGGFLSFWIGKGHPWPRLYEELYCSVALALGLTSLRPFIKNELGKAKMRFTPDCHECNEKFRKPRYAITKKGIRCSAEQLAPGYLMEIPELGTTIQVEPRWRRFSVTYTWEELR